MGQQPHLRVGQASDASRRIPTGAVRDPGAVRHVAASCAAAQGHRAVWGVDVIACISLPALLEEPGGFDRIFDGPRIAVGQICDDHHVLDVASRDAEGLRELPRDLVPVVEVRPDHHMRIVEFAGDQPPPIPPLGEPGRRVARTPVRLSANWATSEICTLTPLLPGDHDRTAAPAGIRCTPTPVDRPDRGRSGRPESLMYGYGSPRPSGWMSHSLRFDARNTWLSTLEGVGVVHPPASSSDTAMSSVTLRKPGAEPRGYARRPWNASPVSAASASEVAPAVIVAPEGRSVRLAWCSVRVAHTLAATAALSRR
jgi:hypothetical protein